MATPSKKVYVKDVNNENITDWQRLMLNGLPPDILEKAKVTFNVKPDTYVNEYGEAGEVTKKLVKGKVTPPKNAGIKTVSKSTGGGSDNVTDPVSSQTYEKDLGTVNGVHLVAKYDEKGNLAGFDEWRKTDSAAPVSRLYSDDKQYFYPKWDATGKPVPAKGYETKSGGGLFSDFFSDVTSGFDDLVLQNPALRAAALGAAAPLVSPAIGSATGLTGSQLAAATGAVTGGTAAALTGNDVLTGALTGGAVGYGASELGLTTPTSGTGTPTSVVTPTDTASTGLLGNTALDANFVAADAAQLANQGLNATQIETTLTSSGVNAFTAADAAQLAVQGLDATQIAANITQGASTATGAAGNTGLFTDAANTTATAAGAGAAKAAVGAAGAGAAGATLGDLGTAALIKGGAALAGGLLQGDTAKTALTEDAAARAKLATEVKDMGKFTPVGITTTFGTSNFVTDPVTGAITPSYTLSPAAQAYQDSLGGLGTTALSSAKDIMSLGNQYIGESPEAVRKRYIDTQAALLQPGQESELAKIRTNLTNTGRGGLSFGATSDGLAATNPELAAYYNSLAMTNRNLAADAEKQYQNQVNFGTGLLGSATTPFTNVFNAQKSVEAQGQQPLTLSTDFANTVATRGAAQGANYANAMNPSLNSTYKANSANPLADFLQGMSSDDLLALGLSKVIKP